MGLGRHRQTSFPSGTWVVIRPYWVRRSCRTQHWRGKTGVAVLEARPDVRHERGYSFGVVSPRAVILAQQLVAGVETHGPHFHISLRNVTSTRYQLLADNLQDSGAGLVKIDDVLNVRDGFGAADVGDHHSIFAEDFAQLIGLEYCTGHKAVSIALEGGVDVLQRPEHAGDLHDEPLLRRDRLKITRRIISRITLRNLSGCHLFLVINQEQAILCLDGTPPPRSLRA